MQLRRTDLDTGEIEQVLVPCGHTLDGAVLRRGRSRRAGDDWHDTGYVFTTRSGLPVEPRNLARSFAQLVEAAGLRPIRLPEPLPGHCRPMDAPSRIRLERLRR